MKLSAWPELAEALGTTRQYLPQILNPLVKARWVVSTPGPHGGYELLVPLRDLGLELVEVMEGQPRTTHASSMATSVPDQLCALHGAWQQAREALTTELSQMTLAAAWGANCG